MASLAALSALPVDEEPTLRLLPREPCTPMLTNCGVLHASQQVARYQFLGETAHAGHRVVSRCSGTAALCWASSCLAPQTHDFPLYCPSSTH